MEYTAGRGHKHAAEEIASSYGLVLGVMAKETF